MSTKVRSAQESTGSVETVFALLTAEAWAERKAVELNDGSRVVRREEQTSGGLLLVVSRELPAGVPGFLERFLPSDGRVVQTDHWAPPSDDGVRTGVWGVEIPGAPASLGGTMRLAPVRAASTYVIEGEVTVRVPLIGGKAERFIGEMVERLAAKEGDLLRRTLHAG